MLIQPKKINTISQEATMVYPNFLYIGAEKAGSSWIFEILREHPEVYVPPAKDIQFFDKNYEKGIDWYLSLFQPGGGRKAIGEVSHDYFLAEQTAGLIKRYLPDVRLICCLREPVDRTMSSYLFYKTTVLNQATTFEQFAFQERTLKLSDYYYNLRPFYERFPRNNILILFFDDLKKDPARFAQRIYEFLQVNPHFQSTVLYQKILPASETRLRWLAHLAYQMGLGFRKLGLVNVVGTVKRTGTFRRLFYKELDKKPQVSPAVKQKLQAYYAERYQLLPELIGMPLPESWSVSDSVSSDLAE